jgi:predicted transcriptional regulator
MKVGDHNANMREMKQRERHGLPHHTVRAIRKLHEKGNITHSQIGELYGIARSTVSEILSGSHYSHVTENGLDMEGKEQ